jgi:hypothetical protein
MRLPFQFQGQGYSRKPLITPAEASSGSDGGGASSTWSSSDSLYGSEYVVPPRPRDDSVGEQGGWEMAVNDEPLNKRIVATLAKKMNCAASKREAKQAARADNNNDNNHNHSHNHHQNHYHNNNHNNNKMLQRQVQMQGDSRTRIVAVSPVKRERPVLITVQEGKVMHSHTASVPVKVPPVVHRYSPPIRTSWSKILDHNEASPKRTRDSEAQQQQQRQQEICATVRPREPIHSIHLPLRHTITVHQKPLAPPAPIGTGGSKWRDGGNLHWKRGGVLSPLFDDDESADDTNSVGEHETVTTGFTGVTGISGYSSATGYTTVTEISDASEEISDDEDYKHGEEEEEEDGTLPRGQEQETAAEELLSWAAEQHNFGKLLTTQNLTTERARVAANTLLAGVAEDLGIVAGFIIMDGKACFNCVAETTAETVYSCRPKIRRHH